MDDVELAARANGVPGCLLVDTELVGRKSAEERRKVVDAELYDDIDVAGQSRLAVVAWEPPIMYSAPSVSRTSTR